jgi:hypothetical protein
MELHKGFDTPLNGLLPRFEFPSARVQVHLADLRHT